MNKQQELENELIRLQNIRSNNNWDLVRNSNNYILNTFQYPWATRNYYSIPKDKYNFYLDLQASRGIKDYENDGITNYINNSKNELKDADKFLDLPHNNPRHQEIKKYLLDSNKISNIYEIGFRFPMLLQSYKNLNLNVAGCDAVKSNVLLGKYLDYNVELIDFNLQENINKVKLQKNTLVISYHCFEHLENPFNSIKHLYNIMPNNSYLHIEVPLEPVKYPNTKVGHLQTFYKDDLKNMLAETGFKFINSFYDKKNERHLVEKFTTI